MCGDSMCLATKGVSFSGDLKAMSLVAAKDSSEVILVAMALEVHGLRV